MRITNSPQTGGVNNVQMGGGGATPMPTYDRTQAPMAPGPGMPAPMPSAPMAPNMGGPGYGRGGRFGAPPMGPPRMDANTMGRQQMMANQLRKQLAGGALNPSAPAPSLDPGYSMPAPMPTPTYQPSPLGQPQPAPTADYGALQQSFNPTLAQRSRSFR